MSAEEFKNKGNTALQAKDYDEAVSMYTKAIELDGSNHVYFSNRSAAYLSKGDAAAALQDAEQCIAVNAQWAKGYSRKGAALHALKRYDDAITAYNDGLAIAPTDAGLKSGLDEVTRAKGASGPAPGGLFPPELLARLAGHPKFGPKLADPAFMAKIQMLQSNPSALGMMMGDPEIMEVFGLLTGLDFSSMGANFNEPPPAAAAPAPAPAREPEPAKEEEEENDEDLTEEEREEKRKRKEAVAAKDRGNSLYKQKKFAEALAAYDEAIALDETNMTFLNNKAAVYLEMNEIDSCIETCKRALEVGDANRGSWEDKAKAWTRIGKAHLKRDDYTSALEALQKAQMEHYTRDTERLIKNLELEKAKRDAAAYVNPELAAEAKERGNVHFRAQEFPKAIEEYQEATKRDPTNPSYRNNLAAALLKVGDFAGARAQCEKALELDPRYVKAWAKKGDIEFFMKEYHKAMESYQRGLAIEENDQLCRQGLQKVMRAINTGTGDDESARERAEHALADPEIQAILQDPIMRNVLSELQTNPQEAQKAMRDPDIARKLEKLIASGVLQMR